MRDLDHQPYLSEIHQPTLVLHGKHDQKQRFEGTEVFKQEMQDVQLVVFEDSAHCPHAEETEKFNEAIRKFIETKISYPNFTEGLRGRFYGAAPFFLYRSVLPHVKMSG